MTDADALTRYARSADAEAFAELVRRYESLVFGVCVRQLGCGADADDATQLTFVKLAKAAGTIQNRLEGTLGAWLHTTAARTAIDLGRQRTTRKKHEAQASVRDRSDAGDADATAFDPAERAAFAELSRELDAAMLELSPGQRQLVVEVFFRGRTQRQVAASTGKSQARVCRELQGAVSALRDRLGQRGVMLPAAALTAGLVDLRAAASAVPANVSAGCVKVGLAGVGSFTVTAGSGASMSFAAWSLTRAGLLCWALVAVAVLGLGLAAFGWFAVPGGSEHPGVLPTLPPGVPPTTAD